ncbi:MAG TPA: translation initiation factor IF-2 [Desulfomonilia bacterium]
MIKKMRIFELAQKFSIDEKELMKICKDLAISAENKMSQVDPHDIDRIKKRLEKSSDKQQDETKTESFDEERVSSKIIRRRAKITTAEVEEVKPVTDHEETQTIQTPEIIEHKPVEAEAKSEIRTPEHKKEEAKQTHVKASLQEKKELTAEPEKKIVQKETKIPVRPAAAQKEEQPPIPVKEVKPEKKVAGQQEKPPIKEEARKLIEEEEKKREKKKPKKKGKVVDVITDDSDLEIVDLKNIRTGVKIPKTEIFPQVEIYDIKPAFSKKPHRHKDKKLHIPIPAKKRKIRIGKDISVLGLAREMGVKVSEVIRVLGMLGMIVRENDYITSDEAVLAAAEMGYEIEETRDDILEDYLTPPKHPEEELVSRSPVVTVMGHVDHGKTSLLDAIRSENVTESEFGGITQHVGAYQARCKDKLITFIDTPGHQAFTAMRARGAQVTDFVVLVVAADDGVMEQTKEAISHARAANIPIIVAVNKIDKPNANPQRVKEQLADQGLVPEDWGGDTVFVEVSAKKHIGIDELLEMILLQAEMLDLKAYSKGAARGTVLESKLDRNKGPMSTIIVQSGELKQGDTFVAGMTWGKVRAMYDFKGASLNSALPSTPVEIIGLTSPPSAGDTFFVVPNDKKAREIIEYLDLKIKQKNVVEQKTQVTLEDLYSQVMEGRLKALNVIIKGDVHGTVEAITGAIKGVETGESIRINVVHSGVGSITENDIMLASTSQAVIIGFNIKPETKVKNLAKNYGIDIKLYTVIYELLDDIKQALQGMLEPVYEDVLQGSAEVRNVFKISRIGTIAGCMVIDGKIQRTAQVKLLRAKDTIWEGRFASLKRFKDDVKEVTSGYECGISLEGFNDLQEGDIIQAFTKEKQEQSLL